ncbi:MAG: hypothetical protein A3B25_01770 [Candidatus Ryanbacteria bacterium RIFCSPLOWO2_01_FULL_48_26]|uniref:POTRA domain-containing protein n=1 Tax=Candidatus Ryanbacteria bacterium RIFCSPLOWO2_01_FULL_48_26 TaxID=1802126 RepID=A0A1G2GW16_9BACT|nr:MAG: hypothetical protein A3B25_01770 [Candidatus Ryanbacteria bacterium RIFCSPLOWO2_01_FULL_48_26]
MQRAKNYLSEIAVRRRRRRVYSFIGGICIAVFFLIVGGGWFFVLSPFFQIEKIDIAGTALVSRSDAVSLLQATVAGGTWWKSLLGFGNILVWPDTLREARDLVFYPAVKDVSISKNYFERTVSVKIEERESIGIWCFHDARKHADDTQNNEESFQQLSAASVPRESASSCWWFDDEGVIFRRSPSAEGNLITIIRDYSQKSRGLNSKILPSKYIKNFLSIIGVIRESKAGLKEVVIKDLALEEVEALARTESGPKLYFSLRFPANSALAAIGHLYAKPGFKNLHYIDFRVENKVYYK